jgi:hypothetical protein
MNRRIGRTERLLNLVARVLMFLVAVGIFAFVGYYVWVVAVAEPIPHLNGVTTSQPVNGSASVRAPGTPPDTLRADTASSSIATSGGDD